MLVAPVPLYVMSLEPFQYSQPTHIFSPLLGIEVTDPFAPKKAIITPILSVK